MAAKADAINQAITNLVLKADLTAYNAALALVSESDYTKDSWNTYKAVVDANAVTVENTQTEVNTATGKITAAQGSLVTKAKSNLDIAKGKADTLTEDNYTIVTWQLLQDALALPESTIAEMAAKADAINQAITNLVLKADLTAYNAALALVSESDYTEDSWNTYKAVVNANAVTAENTQTEVNTATANITAAQVSLVAKAKTNLDIAKGKADTLTENNYTIVTWELLQDALALPESTPAEMAAKADVINQAITNLVLKADLTAYNAALALVSKSDYTEESWSTYKAVVDDNLVTAEKTQTEVNTATANITAAQGSLVTKAKSNLDIAKGKADTLTEDNYTSVMWKALKDALALPESTTAEMAAKTDAINQAITNLVLKADLTAYNAALAFASESDYTKDSWTTYKAVVDANAVTAENTQTEVNTATANITAAQDSLVTKSDVAAVAAAKTVIVGGTVNVAFSATQEDKTAAVQVYVDGLLTGNTTGVTAVVTYGIDNNYRVTLTKGSFNDTTTIPMTIIEGEVPDIAIVNNAKNAAEMASYSNMTQVVATDETVVEARIKAIAEAAVNNSAVAKTVNTVNYTAPIAGTSANPAGTNGSYTFTITVSKGGQTDKTSEKTIIIIATAYTEIPTYQIIGKSARWKQQRFGCDS